MNYNKKSVEDIDVKGKRVLCRCDFNVPTKEGKITSDKRIVAAMPTIEYLVNHGARVILCSHMGKPKGEWKPELSLQVVADRLSELLGLFEHKDSLKKLLPSSLPSADQKDGGVQVYIGSENSVKIMDRSALVFKTVTENGKPIGAIGVIGPTRMDYGRVISVLDRLSEGIGDVITGDGGGDSSPDEKKGET